ncbi:MAG: hypothetical protein JW945_05715 [Methanomicrobia archaeon]|nr:hypothetical protein [Methanomicrobia archaeon]
MTKYHLYWKSDRDRMPADPNERLAGWNKLLSMVKDDLESGRLKDWGSFPGEHAGYAIMEGTEQDVLLGTEKYVPYIRFKTHTVLSVDQTLATMSAAKAQVAAAKK